MLVPILLFALGLLFLIVGGRWFVDGATGIASHFHVPELLIGATVVSIGTTLPEVMVSASAALSGHGEIAYGNAIGSIICNTALIAAITIVVAPSVVKPDTLRIPVIFFFIAAVFYSAVSYITGYFSRLTGIILLCMFVTYLTITLLKLKTDLKKTPADAPKNHVTISEVPNKASKKPSVVKNIVFLVIGAVLIAFGADLLVDNGTLIAVGLGVPESVVALTFVALGTSLPELVTAITSLVKGHGALSLGNIIGANMFNLVFVSGVAITLSPFSIPVEKTLGTVNASLLVDIPLMFAVMLIMLVPALMKGRLYRIQGIILLCLYGAFCTFQFIG